MKSKIFLFLGVGFILVGLGCLSYVGWELYGTNFMSKKSHSQTVDSLEKAWESEANKEVKVPGAKDDKGKTAVSYAYVEIPRFGTDWRTPLLRGDSDSILAHGLGSVESLANPGEDGNFTVVGHRVTHGEPFRNFASLEPGDEVHVVDGKFTYTYVLTDTERTVRFDAGWPLTEVPKDPETGKPIVKGKKKLITLATCSELFSTDYRWVAFGYLKKVEER